jgi:hypothetical protein
MVPSCDAGREWFDHINPRLLPRFWPGTLHQTHDIASIPAFALPRRYTDHGIPGLLCKPPRWTSVLLFYAANYLAHCATVKLYPAEAAAEITLAMGFALFLPFSGFMRAMDPITRRSKIEERLERVGKSNRRRGLVHGCAVKGLDTGARGCDS